MNINVLYHHTNTKGILNRQVGDGDFLIQESKDCGITGGNCSKVMRGIRRNITKINNIEEHGVVYTFFHIDVI